MEKNGLLIVLLLLFMIGFGRSNALNSRNLATTADPNGSSNANQDSPLSSQPPNEKKQNSSPIGETEPKKTNPSDDESKGTNDAKTKTSESSTDKKLDKGKSHDSKEKVDNKTRLQTFATQNCKGNPVCSDQEKTMMACIQDFENGSNNLTLIVQNEQEITLKVNITSGKSMNNLEAFEISGLRTEQVKIKLSGDKSSKVILNAGNGDCELSIDALAVDNSSKSENANTPVKPKDKDVKDPPETKKDEHPSNDKEGKKDEDPSNDKEGKSPVKPKNNDSPTKDADDGTTKAKEADDAAKAKAADDAAAAKAKAADEAAAAKAKAADDAAAAKAKAADDAATAKAKAAEDAAKAKAGGGSIGMETPVSESNLLNQLSFYSKQVTSIYGAYFLFFVALIIGASWVMCSFRKRRTDGGVSYQELEMGLPESSNAIDVETAEGWDQDWDDDDWDEDKAIRSPGAKTISSNGLTSRGSTKKDGWDADWEN